MEKELLTLAATLIGAASGILGGYLASLRQATIEREKWFHTREDEVRKDIRGAVADLMKKLAVGIHAMMWVTWKALQHDCSITVDEVTQYEKEYHQLIGDIVSAQMVLASVNSETYERITPIVSETIKVGSTTYEALLEATSHSKKRRDSLLKANREAFSLIKVIPKQVADIIRI